MFRAILLIISLIISIGAPATSFADVVLDRVVAVVNKEVITWSELSRSLEFEVSKQLKGLTDEQKKLVLKENEASFLNSMVDMKLQLQEARRAGITVSDADIDNAVNEIKNKYSMDEETFKTALISEGISLKEYKEQLFEQIMISRVVEQEVRSKIIITDREFEGNENNNTYLYRLRQIFFQIPAAEDKDSLNKKALTISERLNSGEDFQALARQYSEDPTAETGGDLGFIRKSQMADEFLDALRDMKPGDVSRPFWTERGLHIIKLEETRGARETLLEKRFQERYKYWLRGLRERSHIELRL
jgi:peptidyl-prolyl cis-trans isomerase SurA